MVAGEKTCLNARFTRKLFIYLIARVAIACGNCWPEIWSRRLDVEWPTALRLVAGEGIEPPTRGL